MYCYYCTLEPPAGGARYFTNSAVGICLHCGAAVCSRHGRKDPAIGNRLLCDMCARSEAKQASSSLATPLLNQKAS